MDGTKGRAPTYCDPEGQAREKGQIWKATCPDGARAGDDVIVTGMTGLRLEVRHAPLARSTGP
jgi:membrane protein implicated in regulation of membrane protease activity